MMGGFLFFRYLQKERSDLLDFRANNYRVNQEMSPRLAAFIKKIENGSPELSTEMFQVPSEKQDD